MDTNITVNLVAVVAAAVAAFAVGALWYSPVLFAKPWMKLLGKTEKDIKEGSSNMPLLFGLTFVGLLIESYVLAHFVNYMQASTPMMAAQTGIWLWLGFIATTMLSNYLYTGKPVKLYLIDTGHHLVALVVMGVVLTLVG